MQKPEPNPDDLGVPPHVDEAVFEYRTAELCTLTSREEPVTWPVIGLYERDRQRFLVSTPIGMPFKAYHLRRNPRCAVLFSNPTASGSENPPAVLIQGRGRCPDEILVGTSHPDVRRLGRHVHGRQPGGEMYVRNPVLRRLMDWYYMRLLVYVEAERVTWWEAGDFAGPAASAGSLGEPEEPRVADTGGERDVEAVAKMDRQLAIFESAVLSAVGGDGYPVCVRCRPRHAGSAARLALEVPADINIVEGPAHLLCHSHDDRVGDLRSCGCRGFLRRDGEGWSFEPLRFQPGIGMGGLAGRLGMVFRCRRNARRYLDRRGLPRPAIPWQEIREAWDSVKSGEVAGGS